VMARVEELLARDSRRLTEARTQLATMINRPGPELAWRTPRYVTPHLAQALSACGMLMPFRFTGNFTHAEKQLQRASIDLIARTRTNEQRKAHLQEQQFSAYLLRGSVAMTRADAASGNERRMLANKARFHFEAGLNTPKFEYDLIATESLAGCQLRLEQAALALQTIDNLLEKTASSPYRGIDLARLHWIRAQCYLHSSIYSLHNANAALIRATDAIEPIALVKYREQLDAVKMHLLHAEVRIKQKNRDVAEKSLDAAEDKLTNLLCDLNHPNGDPKLTWWIILRDLWHWDRTVELRREAINAWQRAEELRKLFNALGAAQLAAGPQQPTSQAGDGAND
jgi:hypothetical protein